MADEGTKMQDELRNIVMQYLDDVPEPYRSLLEDIGFDALYKILCYWGGSSIYIPTLKRVFAECVKKQVEKEFNGANHKQLAHKYGYSDRSIRHMVGGVHERCRQKTNKH